MKPWIEKIRFQSQQFKRPYWENLPSDIYEEYTAGSQYLSMLNDLELTIFLLLVCESES